MATFQRYLSTYFTCLQYHSLHKTQIVEGCFKFFTDCQSESGGESGSWISTSLPSSVPRHHNSTASQDKTLNLLERLKITTKIHNTDIGNFSGERKSFGGFPTSNRKWELLKEPTQSRFLSYCINKSRAFTQFEQKLSLMDCKSSSIHQFHTDIAISQEEKRCPALQAVLVDATSPALQQGHATGIPPLTTPTEVK